MMADPTSGKSINHT